MREPTLHDIPQTWKMTTIGEVTEEKVPQTGPKDAAEFIYVDIGSIDNTAKRITEPKSLSVTQAPSRARQNLKAGDVLVSMTRPNLNAVAIVPPELEGTVGSTGFHVLRAKQVEPAWLFFTVQCNAFIDAMCLRVQGALYPAVRPKDIREYPLTLPSLSEQKSIVAEIEKQFTRLDAGMAALKRVQANLKRYRAAVLKAACEGKLVPTEAELHRVKSCKSGSGVPPLNGKEDQSRDGSATLETYEPADKLLDRILTERRKKWNGKGKYKEPGTPDTSNLPELPDGWVWVGIESFLNSASDGMKTGPFGTLLKKNEHVSDGVAVIGIENIGHNVHFIHGSKIHITHRKAAELENYDIQPGDIVVSRSGTVGELCVIPDSVNEARFSTNIMRLRLTSSLCDSRFFCCLFTGSPFILQQVHDLCKGSTRDFLNQHILKSITFPLPPFAEQKRIIEEVERRLSVVEELEAVVDANLQRATRLRQSILQKAFSGRQNDDGNNDDDNDNDNDDNDNNDNDNNDNDNNDNGNSSSSSSSSSSRG